jgi:hypothetical protein
MYDFRKFSLSHINETLKYEFVILNTDDKQLFKLLINFNLGVFDTPGVFAITDF